GRYRINPPDFRLREAINQAGGLDPSVKVIYVFRNEPKPKRVIDRGVHPSGENSPQMDMPAPPVVPGALSERAGGPNASAGPAPSSAQPSSREVQPRRADTAHNADR